MAKNKFVDVVLIDDGLYSESDFSSDITEKSNIDENLPIFASISIITTTISLFMVKLFLGFSAMIFLLLGLLALSILKIPPVLIPKLPKNFWKDVDKIKNKITKAIENAKKWVVRQIKGLAKWFKKSLKKVKNYLFEKVKKAWRKFKRLQIMRKIFRRIKVMKESFRRFKEFAKRTFMDRVKAGRELITRMEIVSRIYLNNLIDNFNNLRLVKDFKEWKFGLKLGWRIAQINFNAKLKLFGTYIIESRPIAFMNVTYENAKGMFREVMKAAKGKVEYVRGFFGKIKRYTKNLTDSILKKMGISSEAQLSEVLLKKMGWAGVIIAGLVTIDEINKAEESGSKKTGIAIAATAGASIGLLELGLKKLPFLMGSMKALTAVFDMLLGSFMRGGALITTLRGFAAATIAGAVIWIVADAIVFTVTGLFGKFFSKKGFWESGITIEGILGNVFDWFFEDVELGRALASMFKFFFDSLKWALKGLYDLLVEGVKSASILSSNIVKSGMDVLLDVTGINYILDKINEAQLVAKANARYTKMLTNLMKIPLFTISLTPSEEDAAQFQMHEESSTSPTLPKEDNVIIERVTWPMWQIKMLLCKSLGNSSENHNKRVKNSIKIYEKESDRLSDVIKDLKSKIQDMKDYGRAAPAGHNWSPGASFVPK